MGCCTIFILQPILNWNKKLLTDRHLLQTMWLEPAETGPCPGDILKFVIFLLAQNPKRGRESEWGVLSPGYARSVPVWHLVRPFSDIDFVVQFLRRKKQNRPILLCLILFCQPILSLYVFIFCWIRLAKENKTEQNWSVLLIFM